MAITSIKGRAAVIAEQTADAYSVNRYVSWTRCAEMLLTRGYSDEETTAILRSKWTRWAADESANPYGEASAQDLANWMDNPRNRASKDEVAKLL